jgi:hypothetical protein
MYLSESNDSNTQWKFEGKIIKYYSHRTFKTDVAVSNHVSVNTVSHRRSLKSP